MHTHRYPVGAQVLKNQKNVARYQKVNLKKTWLEGVGGLLVSKLYTFISL